MSSLEDPDRVDAPVPPTDRRPRLALIGAGLGFVLTAAAGSYVFVVARTGLGSLSMAEAVVALAGQQQCQDTGAL